MTCFSKWYSDIDTYICIHMLHAGTVPHPGLAESGVGGGSQREMMRLKKTNQQLNEENNLLKLKVDILLDMVSIRFLFF